MSIDDEMVSLGDEDQCSGFDDDLSKRQKSDGSKKKSSKKIMGPKEILLDLLEKLKNKDKTGIFMGKVDKYTVPDYRKVVKIPMYFNKMERKINKGKYRDIEQFVKDVKHICTNALLYNGQNSAIGKAAISIEKHMQRLNQAAPQRWAESLQHAQSKGLTFDKWIQQSCNLPTDRPLPPAKIEQPREPNETYPPDSDSDESLPPPPEEKTLHPPSAPSSQNANANMNNSNNNNASAAPVVKKPAPPPVSNADPLPDVSAGDRTLLKKLFGHLRTIPTHHTLGLAYLRDAQIATTTAIHQKMIQEHDAKGLPPPPAPSSIPSIKNKNSSEYIAPFIPERRVLHARSAIGYAGLGDCSQLFAAYPGSSNFAVPSPIAALTVNAEEPGWHLRTDRPVSFDDSLERFLLPAHLQRGPQAAPCQKAYDIAMEEHKARMQKILNDDAPRHETPIGPFMDPRFFDMDGGGEFSSGVLDKLPSGWVGKAAAEELLTFMKSVGTGQGLKRLLKDREEDFKNES
eukprot:GDKJ01023914.1.p1 GENE.GDKJ01023914.1~~GDKJ01023914.1.p1  ORF type:complete len:514 (-),score=125.24 GDKJ01023914.1:95-1636(-)